MKSQREKYSKIQLRSIRLFRHQESYNLQYRIGWSRY